VICEHGEPWWNDVDRGKLMIFYTRALWQSYQQSSSSKAVETGEGNDAFLLYEISVSYFERFFNML
jgi:hypothetical protein